MSYEVYFEAQDEGSALCGQHAINNLLQGAYFTAIDLGHIGAKLDEEEQNLLSSIDEDEKLSEEPVSDQQESNNFASNGNNNRERKYSNVSMEGLFSVDVLITALKQIKIDAIPLSHPDCLSANEHPDQEQGFIFYQMSHWIAYRKINNIWYDLNSQSNYLLLDPEPARISEFYLSAQLSKLQDEGFQVYVIRGKLPELARYAPKANDLKGEYYWYQSADIKSHVELDKQSRLKQKEEQERKTRELMIRDPQQYNALMGNNNNNGVYAMGAINIPSQYQMYHEQQQWLAMQQYQPQQDEYNNFDTTNHIKAAPIYTTSDNNTSNIANDGGIKDNGIMAKMGNPFSKLKTYYNEKTKELKTKMNKTNNDNDNNVVIHNNPDQFLSDLEKAKQESLKMAQNNNNNNNILSNPPKKNAVTFQTFNSPQIEQPAYDDHSNYAQKKQEQQQQQQQDQAQQHQVVYNNHYGQQIMVVQPNQTQLTTNTTDEDVELAMALSASIAANGGVPPDLPQISDNNRLPPPKKQNIELQFEMTDHKPKIIKNQQQQQQQQQEDFLDLTSMNNNNNNMSNTEEVDMVLDTDDPFTSLIREYSNDNKTTNKGNKGNNGNNGNDLNLLDFDNNNNIGNIMGNTQNNNNGNNGNNGNDLNLFDFDVNNNNNKKKENVQFEDNLFGDDKTNDVMSLIDNGKVENHMISTTNNDNNPLIISPNNNNNNNNNNNMYNNNNNKAQRMEDDIWEMLEKQLTNN